MSQIETLKDADRMKRYREDNFAIKIEPLTPVPFSESELLLSVTYNGNQWHSLGLTNAEATNIYLQLETYLKGLE